MSKLSKNAVALLASLRDNAFGAVRHTAELRYTSTDASYGANAAGKEGQIEMQPAAFSAALNELIVSGNVVWHDTGEPASDYEVLLPSLLKESDVFNVKKATMGELVAKFNELSPKQVKRFADRATAEKRVNAVLNGAEIDDSKLAKAEKAPATAKAESVEKGPASKGKAKGGTKPAPKAPKAKQLPLEGVPKKSRKAPEGSRLDQRTVRHHVRVNGVEYRSVKEAFTANKLPLGGRIKFRIGLKTSASGRARFEHKGNAYDFTLVAK